MAILGDEEGVALLLADVPAHSHRLGGGGGFVEQRGVRQRKAGQLADHGLKIQQRFEPALGDFGLVGRVLRIPAGIFQDVSLNHGRV